jgi:phosphoribosylaminoimidazolecarboxamide formyltransferase/IMP cyclohydrolase
MTLKTRFELAQKAFAHTAAYDAAIAAYLKSRSYDDVKAVYHLG